MSWHSIQIPSVDMLWMTISSSKICFVKYCLYLRDTRAFQNQVRFGGKGSLMIIAEHHKSLNLQPNQTITVRFVASEGGLHLNNLDTRPTDLNSFACKCCKQYMQGLLYDEAGGGLERSLKGQQILDHCQKFILPCMSLKKGARATSATEKWTGNHEGSHVALETLFPPCGQGHWQPGWALGK